MKPLRTSLIVLLIIVLVSLTQTRQIQLNTDLQARYTPRKTEGKYSGILGFIIGPILFVSSFVGIWFNEKRAAVNYRRFKLTEKLLDDQSTPKQYNLDSMDANFVNQKTLTHQTGWSEIIEAARDDECLVFPPDAIVIQRKVEVKEMRAQTKRRSGEDEVSYKLEWVSCNIEQCEAQSNSPLRWFIQNKQFYAPRVRVSNYFLNQSQMRMLDCDSEITPTAESINAISQIAQSTGNHSTPIPYSNYLYFPGVDGDVQSRGSLRVKFTYCKSTQLSIICTIDQPSQTYEPFRIDLVDNDGQEDQPPCEDAQCCICCGKLAQALQPISEINLIQKGILSTHEMVTLSLNKNQTQTNLLRLLFFVIMVVGICVFFSPFVEVLGYIPIVGGFLKGTASIIIFIAAFLVSIPMFLITFGLAWLRYHPLIGGAICSVAVVLLILFTSVQK